MSTPVRKERRGSALVTLMIIITLASVAGAAMVGFAKQQAYSMTKIRDYLKAQAFAEAGANQAYAVLKEAFADASDPSKFPAQSIGDGGYDATVTLVGSNKASIVSVGHCGNSTITVKADVWNQAPASGGGSGGTEPPTDPYAYTWLVNGQMRMNGQSEFVGFLHANNDIDVNGASQWGTATEPTYASASVGIRFSGPCTLYGDVWSPSISGSFAPGTTTIAPSPAVPIPELDLAGLYAIASANGQVVGSQTISADTLWNIPGGVKWVNGSLTVKSGKKLTWTGCIVATGAIEFKGQLHATRYLNYPTIISRDSSITVRGQHTFNGLMYSGGDILFCGSGTFEGSIICGGNLRFNGSGERFSYVDCRPGGGGGSGSGSTNAADHVIITAWQQ